MEISFTKPNQLLYLHHTEVTYRPFQGVAQDIMNHHHLYSLYYVKDILPIVILIDVGKRRFCKQL